MLDKLFRARPELRAAPLYLTGESFAGHYVPAAAALIQWRTAINDEDWNLKG